MRSIPLAHVLSAMVLLTGLGNGTHSHATGNLLQTFNDPTPTAADQFGWSVALDGNNVLIGARLDDTNGRNVGQAHLFDTATGNLLQTFNAPTPTDSDWFGTSVALDGNNVLIGAQNDDTYGRNVGQAHLFDTATGNLLQTFNDPTPTGSDWFGYSVALDGNNVLIGARLDDTNGTDVGQAHLFDTATGNLLQTFNDPTPTGSDWFGYSVALDDNNVLIGAISDDTNGNDVGQAHLFDAATGNLLQTFNDPTPTSDQFGYSVALDGNNVLIGARLDDTNGTGFGQAYLFDTATGNLLQTFNDPTPTAADQFGWSVALDGNNVLIGARLDNTNGNNVGQAHLFDAATGNLLQTFNDPTPTSDQFGYSVALDGNNILIGAGNDDTNGTRVGQAHLFQINLEVIPGDFNKDGLVTPQDYSTWRDAYGTSVNPGDGADGNSDGMIDGADYTVWRDAFASASSAVSVSVPEPSSLLLLASSSIIGLATRRRTA